MDGRQRTEIMKKGEETFDIGEKGRIKRVVGWKIITLI